MLTVVKKQGEEVTGFGVQSLNELDPRDLSIVLHIYQCVVGGRFKELPDGDGYEIRLVEQEFDAWIQITNTGIQGNVTLLEEILKKLFNFPLAPVEEPQSIIRSILGLITKRS